MQHRLNERLKCWSAMFRSHYTIQFHKLLLYKLFIAVHCKFRPQNTMAMLPCSMANGCWGMRNATSNKMSTYVTYSLSFYVLCISHDNHFTIFSVHKVHTVVHAGRHEECIYNTLHWLSGGRWSVRSVYVKWNCLENNSSGIGSRRSIPKMKTKHVDHSNPYIDVWNEHIGQWTCNMHIASMDIRHTHGQTDRRTGNSINIPLRNFINVVRLQVHTVHVWRVLRIYSMCVVDCDSIQQN